MTDKTSTIRTVALRDLYRSTDTAWLPADVLARRVAGELPVAERERVAAVLATSPAQAALTKVLAELAPDSARLAAAIDAADTAHRRHARRGFRHAAGHVARRHHGLRWVGVAAALAMALGLWSWHRVDVMHDAPALVSSPAAVPQGDTIFGNGMDGNAAAPARGDEIFRANFNRRS